MNPTNMPIAPSATIKHKVAWRRCKDFDLTSTVRVISTHNPWRPRSMGYPLFEKVLRIKTNTTIGQILDDAEQIGYYRSEVMRHLRWLYTWGDFIEIDGKRYFPPKQEPGKEVVGRKKVKELV